MYVSKISHTHAIIYDVWSYASLSYERLCIGSMALWIDVDYSNI